MWNGKFIGQLPENSKTICILILMYKTKGLSEVGLKKLRQLHRGAFCQFPFRQIYYYGSNKSTGKETEKRHLCELLDASECDFSCTSKTRRINPLPAVLSLQSL